MRLWQGTSARALVPALIIVLALPGAALGAEPVFEKHKVPTVGGAETSRPVTASA